MAEDSYVVAGDQGYEYVQWSPTPPSNSRVLPPGIYRPIVIKKFMSEAIGYHPIQDTNDKAIECNAAVTATLLEVATFLNSGSTYRRFDIPHKRGYLFYGPPGCGKSTALRLLAERFIAQTNGIVLRLQEAGQRIHPWFNNIRYNEPDRPVLVLTEDIDDDLDDFETSLLEFLDGSEALNNFIFVATTNNLNAIPARIKYRPSRIDRIVEITSPTPNARTEYLKRFPLTEQQRIAIAEVTEGITMADLKEVVIAVHILGEGLESAVERVRRGVEDNDEEEETFRPSTTLRKRIEAAMYTSVPQAPSR